MAKNRRRTFSGTAWRASNSRTFFIAALLIGLITILSLLSLVQLGNQAAITGAAVLNSGSVAVMALTAGEVQFLGLGSMLAVLVLAGVLLHVVKEHHRKRLGN